MPPENFINYFSVKYGLNSPKPQQNTEVIDQLKQKYAPKPTPPVNHDFISSLFQKYNVPIPDYMQKYARRAEPTGYKETVNSFINNAPKIADAAQAPISTFGTPALKKIGVPSALATGIGIIGDIVAVPSEDAKYGLDILKKGKITPETKAEMTKFIDYARGLIKPTKEEMLALEESAARFAEDMGARVGKTRASLANAIDGLLTHLKTSTMEKSKNVLDLRSQTKDLRNPLVDEARKYKSAEEFVSKIRGSATQYGDYTPQFRYLGMEDYKNVAELGVKPDETVRIYRGIDKAKGKIKKQINDGDFVTTDFDSAASYAGKENVVSMEVPAKTLYTDAIDDFKAEPFYTGSEYVYTKQKVSHLTKSQLTDIWKEATQGGEPFNP